MNKTFFKSALTVTHLIVSVLVAVGCIVFACVYDRNQMAALAIGVGGPILMIVQMVVNYNKHDVYKRVRVTDEYIEVMSAFKLAKRINFADVVAAGKFSLAVTKATREKYYFSTVNYSQKNVVPDKSNTIEFDRTAKTEVIFEYIMKKYDFKRVDF